MSQGAAPADSAQHKFTLSSSGSELSDEEFHPVTPDAEPKPAAAAAGDAFVTVDLSLQDREASKQGVEDFSSLLTRGEQSANLFGSGSSSRAEVKVKNRADPPVRAEVNRMSPGGGAESSALLVDYQVDDSDSDEEIPLSWQRTSRSMREQLLRDGYSLDAESDDDDLDLIPPKQSASRGGGICSCSSDSCLIS